MENLNDLQRLNIGLRYILESIGIVLLNSAAATMANWLSGILFGHNIDAIQNDILRLAAQQFRTGSRLVLEAVSMRIIHWITNRIL